MLPPFFLCKYRAIFWQEIGGNREQMYILALCIFLNGEAPVEILPVKRRRPVEIFGLPACNRQMLC